MTSAAQIIRRRRARHFRRQHQQARNRIWGILLLVLLLGLIVVPAGIGIGGALLTYLDAVAGLPAPRSTIGDGAMPGITEMYDRTGQTLLVAAQAGDQRAWVALSDLPTHALRATLLAEDPVFLTRPRVDWINTAIRLWENMLFGPLAPDPTLTGRLVRTAIAPLPEVVTVKDIGREIALVAEIQRQYSPEEILEWYLNTADYGNGAYGLDAAARLYLGKSASTLSIDEAALLAAIPLAPQYNPFDNEIAARGRQGDILRALRAAGQINSSQFEVAASTITPIQVSADQPQQIAPEFVAYARRQARDILDDQGRDGARLVARGGLRILTTLDLDLYYQSECALRAHLARLNGRATSPDALDGRPCQTALSASAIEPLPAESAPDDGALVILDVATGEIRSMVGAAPALRYAPGPTLQPFVYFTGFIRSADHPAKMVLDIPRAFPGAVEGLIYTPNNPDGRFRGPLNLRDAMSAWLLPPAVQIAREAGLDNVLRLAHRIGLNSLGEDGRYDLSLLERGGAVSLLDMTYAYSVFAGLGDMRGIPAEAIGPGYRQRNPAAVLRIEDGEGNLLWQYGAEEVTQNQVGVFPHGVGYLVNDILSDSIHRRALLGDTAGLELSRPVAVVNGLASGGAVSWTVGYTPYMVTGVVIGRTDGASMGLDALGLSGAAVPWRPVMQYAHDRANLPPLKWERPEEVVEVVVCERSGMLPNSVCPTRTDVFIQGRAPLQADTYWQQVEINSQTGQLATASTPREFRQPRVYFIPPPEAEDWWRANNQPLPPTQYDTVSRPELFRSVQILQPQPYAYVGGQVDIRGTLDPANMQYYRLSYGQGQNPTEWIQIGEPQTEFNRGASLGQWQTAGLNGLYNILLTVVRGDNTSETSTVQVIVDNMPPRIALSAGEPGQVIRWPTETTLSLQAQVDDDYAIDRVEFYLNGEFLGADTDSPFGFNWKISGTGSETFSAVAFDAVGNQANSEITVEIQRG